MIMKRTWSAAALLLLAGCTGSPGSGTLTGHFSAVGGPAPGSMRPMRGSVTADGPGGRHVVTTASDGSYRLTLPPGTYSVTAKVPGGTGPCQADAPVVITRGTTSRADVICDIR